MSLKFGTILDIIKYMIYYTKNRKPNNKCQYSWWPDLLTEALLYGGPVSDVRPFSQKNMLEKDSKGYSCKFNIAGYNKKTVKAKIEKNKLTVTGIEKEDLLVEIYIPEDADKKNIKLSLTDGLLDIFIPLKKENIPFDIPIS